MDTPIVEGVILTVIFAACVAYISRKFIAKFSPSATGGCSGCKSCSDAMPKTCGSELAEPGEH